MKVQVFFRAVEANGKRRTRTYTRAARPLLSDGVVQLERWRTEDDPVTRVFIPLDMIERWEVIEEPEEV